MIEAYIGLLIFWPLAAGLACLGLRGPGARSALVLATGAVLAAGAVGLATQTPLALNPAFLSCATALHVAQAAAFLFPAYFLFQGIREKHGLVMLFASAQLALAAYGEFGLPAPRAAQDAVFCDGLALALVLVASLVGSLISIFALPYMQRHEEHLHLKTSRQPQFFLILLAFLGLMNGLALAGDLRLFAAFFEGTTLCSYLLIGHDRTAEAKKSALRALWMNCMGGMFLHAGILLAQKQFGLAGIRELASPALWAGATLLPLALILVAACVKAAQLPFQAWLLGAMVAPTPVSALLHSSTMVKVGVFVCLRLAPVLEGTTTGRILTLAGALTFLGASALALGQSNAKKILAYSTAANLGLIIACAGIGTPTAIAAGVVLLVIHAVTKGLLFLCVGDMEQTVGSRDLEDLRGILAKTPLTALAASAGAMAMILPPLGMLAGKWAALEAASASPAAMVMLAVGSALGVVCWVRFSGTLMGGVAVGPQPAHASGLTSGPILALLAGAVGLGMAAPWLNALLLPAGQGSPLAGGWGLLPPLFATAMLAWIAGLKVLGRQSLQPLAAPYVGGLPQARPGSFVGALGRNWTLSEGNEYAPELFGEAKLTRLAGALAIALLLALVGGALI
ncbi:MAG: NADH-quinone oxidoreductase subunit L [Proteobacteria bacterium]|nr:NADH-quinone oxidoreductase subunit L [Pseudomonadota bacterium]MBU1595553.1 NADH-quinone oxidoreductase subunit L [Pseudomonadota bacterium]